VLYEIDEGTLPAYNGARVDDGLLTDDLGSKPASTADTGARPEAWCR
jgi:hypothetical protein